MWATISLCANKSPLNYCDIYNSMLIVHGSPGDGLKFISYNYADIGERERKNGKIDLHLECRETGNPVH